MDIRYQVAQRNSEERLPSPGSGYLNWVSIDGKRLRKELSRITEHRRRLSDWLAASLSYTKTVHYTSPSRESLQIFEQVSQIHKLRVYLHKRLLPQYRLSRQSMALPLHWICNCESFWILSGNGRTLTRWYLAALGSEKRWGVGVRLCWCKVQSGLWWLMAGCCSRGMTLPCETHGHSWVRVGMPACDPLAMQDLDRWPRKNEIIPSPEPRRESLLRPNENCIGESFLIYVLCGGWRVDMFLFSSWCSGFLELPLQIGWVWTYEVYREL